jgi:hypothetical protein
LAILWWFSSVAWINCRPVMSGSCNGLLSPIQECTSVWLILYCSILLHCIVQ